VVPVTGKGTFKEAWQLQWQPEFVIAIVEASIWGSSVVDAASARARDLAERSSDLPAQARLLDCAILADLSAAVESIMTRLETQASIASDVTQLMDALPPLANLLRYGNVRKSDATMVAHASRGMIARICIGLPLACASLDDDAADTMFGSILKTDSAIKTVQDNDQRETWHATLKTLADSERLHQLVAGRCCRILLDARALDTNDVACRMSLAIAIASEPARAAAWIEGFLRGSGELLCHDDALLGLFDRWLTELSSESFVVLLPLLRRTFSSFEAPVRRILGEKAKREVVAAPLETRASHDQFDEERAATILPLLSRLLGLGAPDRAHGESGQQEQQ
jgi:hypothetical protein